MKRNLIIASIFMVPMAGVIPMPGTIIWYPQLLTLCALGLIFIALELWNMNKYISLFLIYSIFSYIFVCGQAPRTMLLLIFSFAAMFLSYVVSKIDDVKPIYYALIAMVTLNSIYVFLQYLHIDPFFTHTGTEAIDRMVGFMGSRNQLGVFQATLGLISIILMPLTACIVIIPLMLVKGASALIGLSVGATCYLFLLGKRKLAMILIIMAALLIPFFFKQKSVELKERVDLWSLTIKQSVTGKATAQLDKNVKRVYSANPWFGFGLGKFFEVSPRTQIALWEHPKNAVFEHAHNDSVEVLFEFGYIGFILFLCCVGRVILDFLHCLHIGHPNTKYLVLSFCALVTIAACSFGVYIVHAPVSLFIFALMLGLFYREVRYVKQSQIT